MKVAGGEVTLYRYVRMLPVPRVSAMIIASGVVGVPDELVLTLEVGADGPDPVARLEGVWPWRRPRPVDLDVEWPRRRATRPWGQEFRWSR